MRGEFAIIMPRIRGRTRGLLGPVAQSPCGLVLLDTTASAAPVVRDLCAELELYARAAGITTLRVNMETAFCQGFGQGRGQGRGAAEILSAISALRSRGLSRIAVVCATPPAQATARNVTRFPLAQPPVDSWAEQPDGVRIVVGLASAIGSVAEVARGVAVVSAGPVASASMRESAATLSEASDHPGADAAAPAPENGLPVERDHPAQLAHLLLTLPEGGLDPGARAQTVAHIYRWLTQTLEVTRPAHAACSAPPARSALPTRPTRRLSWAEALAWLDGEWETILTAFATRDPERAERAWALTDQYLAAEGGYAVGVNVRAAAFVRWQVDDAARQDWVRAYGAALAAVTPRAVERLRQHAPGDTPDGPPPEHAVS